MNFNPSLKKATLLKRYKRFLADVRLPSGEVIVAHVPNSGSMLGVSTPESPCFVSKSDSLTRKLPYTLEQVFTTEGTWVGVNTSTTNKLVKEAFENKVIPHWGKFDTLAAEVKINAESRLDFCLSNSNEPKSKKHFVEVKNVSMARPPVAVFPDAVTVRGQKHLRELMKLIDEGHTAEIFFVVQREDCQSFSPATDIDPEYSKLLTQALNHGVKVSCWACTVTEKELAVARPLQIKI